MRRFGWLFAALLWLACAGVAWADEFSLPGLEADANAYESSLTARFPAGGTPQGRKQAETQAVAAAKKQDWAAAAAAWERRIAQGDAQPEQWLALAEVQMHRTPPEARHALEAAWENFQQRQRPEPGAGTAADGRGAEGADRPAQAIQALEAATERAPDSKAIAQKLMRHGAPPASWSAASRRNPRPSRHAPASRSPSPRSAATISIRRTG